MKQLYSARYAPEAHELRLFLAAHDIDAKVIGDNNAFEAVFSFHPQSTPSLLVDEADYDRASALLVQFANRPSSPEPQPSWTCPKCQTIIESQFDGCWKCGASRGDSPLGEVVSSPIDDADDECSHTEAKPPGFVVPILPGSTRNTATVWFAMFAVIALTMPLYSGHSLSTWMLYALNLHSTLANFYLPAIMQNVFDAVIVLTAVRLSGESWSTLGIKKLTMADLLTGGIVCIVSYAFAMMGTSIFVDVLRSMFGDRYVYQLIHTRGSSFHVSGWTGLVTLLALSIAIGLSEELMFRGYLVSRLERLLSSTWACVLISAALFGLLHWRRGPITVCDTFLAGIVYGITFAWTRSLWPVAIAHAAHDFSAFLHHAS